MGGRRILAVSLAAAVAIALLPAPTAQGEFHLMKIREVHTGGAANDSYVVLQAHSAGQNLVGGHSVTAYDASGTQVGSFTFGGNVGNNQNQMTILVADTGYSTTFPSPAPAPDGTSASLNLNPAGGAACFEGIDCVSWGNFTGAGSLPSATGTPASGGGVTAGKALHRSIAAGCSTLLESTDDTNSSAADFSEQAPNPRSNSSPIVETECSPSTAPDTTIGNPKPANPANSTTAAFNFTASPPDEATFECKLDAEPDFTACTSPKAYTGLAGGAGTSHTFQVRAVHPTNGKDPTPASYTWVIDTVPPTATILTHPPDPGPGSSAAFTYSSNEGGSSFECSLAPSGGPDSFSSCPSTGKTYSGPLADGSWTFKVRATDPANNQGAPGEFEWTVDNSLNDETPPQTTIVLKPPDPSPSSTAAFTYESNEPPSTFECKLDGGGFVGCDAAGVTYFGLENGPHSFQVRARDPSGNLDESPAGYSWSVAVPAFEPPLLPPPLLPPLASGSPQAEHPQTILTGKPRAVTRDRTPTFRFRSNVAGASFQCKVDRGAFRRCSSPFTTRRLSFGAHTVRIRAAVRGSVDPSPAKKSFRVVKQKRKRRQR